MKLITTALELLGADEDATKLLYAWWRLRRLRKFKARHKQELVSALRESNAREYTTPQEAPEPKLDCNCVTSIAKVRAIGEAFPLANASEPLLLTVCTEAWTQLLGECAAYMRYPSKNNIDPNTLVFETAGGRVSVTWVAGKHRNKRD